MSVGTLPSTGELGTPIRARQRPYTSEDYLAGVEAASFDWRAYLGSYGKLLLEPAGRREAAKYDPLLFALLYLRHHLKDKNSGEITFASCHFDWYRQALEWADGGGTEHPLEWRRAYIAPRHTGKSTFWYLIAPMWAAAYGWVSFAAAFSDSSTQAEAHLATFKKELEENRLLGKDFPDLCAPARRRGGMAWSDNVSQWISHSGFVFAAHGITSGVLGIKVGDKRPDLMILDDIEPAEESYSPYLMKKRLSTVQDVIFPMNDRARVVIAGTVTMAGSIIHQLVKAAADQELADWIKEEQISVSHHAPIEYTGDGEPRSIWEAKWSLEHLQSICHTRSYKKNFANDPAGDSGAFWTENDFVYGELDGATRVALFVDPATTKKRSSDFTGLSIVAYSPSVKKAVVLWADESRKTGSGLRAQVLGILSDWPEIGMVVVESNQGGDHWEGILHDLPCRLRVVHSVDAKEVRAGRVLNHYQRYRVLHARPLHKLEEQMRVFPDGLHDDLVDAVGLGVEFFLAPKTNVRARGRTLSYVG